MEEDKKPDLTGATEHCNIKVVSQDGASVQFKIKKKAPLRKLMTAYCDRQGHPENSVIFLYDGRRIRQEDTPNDLGMEDDDNQLDVMMAQEGGSGKCL